MALLEREHTMRQRTRQIVPEFEPLDRRDVPGGGAASPASALVAPAVAGMTTTTYTGTLLPERPEYHGSAYRATAIVTQDNTAGTFTAQVTVREPAYDTVEYYGYGPNGPIAGTINPTTGDFHGTGSGTDGMLTIDGRETLVGMHQMRLDFTWTVSVGGEEFSSGTGTFISNTVSGS
jgi:hypothetical protein